MKNSNFQEKQFQISNPIESYLESIASYDIAYGKCISRCVEKLKQNEP